MSRYKLKPAKGHGVFYKIIKSGRKIVDPPVISSICFSDECDISDLSMINQRQKDNHKTQIIFYAVSVGKKVSKRAVVRNRIKRLMRAALLDVFRRNEIAAEKIEVIALSWVRKIEKPQMIKLADVLPHIEAVIIKALKNT